MINNGKGYDILDDQISISFSPMSNKCRESKAVVYRKTLKKRETEIVTEKKADTSIRCDKTIDMFPDK